MESGGARSVHNYACKQPHGDITLSGPNREAAIRARSVKEGSGNLSVLASAFGGVDLLLTGQEQDT